MPRFGTGSIKKIEDEVNWAMVEKPKHVAAGMDPFTYKKMEKKLEKEKQDLRELKNKMLAQQTMTGNKRTHDQILSGSSKAAPEVEEGEI